MSTQTQKDGGGGVSQAGETLTVTDNRTGKTYEVPITDGTVRAMDFRQMKVAEDDFGLMTYDPAFTNTASCRSSITYIDGDVGILEYRGYPIEQLAEQSTYLEVAYLLVHGELPTQAQLDQWTHDITMHTFVHENVKEFMAGFRHDAHPMGMLVGSVGALSTFYPNANRNPRPGLASTSRPSGSSRRCRRWPPFAYRHNMASRTSIRTTTCPTRQLPLDDVQDDRGQVRAGPRGSSGALDILFILHADPRAERVDERRAPSDPQVDPYSARSPRASARSTGRCTAAPRGRAADAPRSSDERIPGSSRA
jgi:citrate synthase